MSFFITFEGIEGSGKTTQLLCLQKYLHTLGDQTVAEHISSAVDGFLAASSFRPNSPRRSA